MLWHRGFNRGSKIGGLSVHNQWIECLWREVFIEVGQFYYTLFYLMEENGILESTSIVNLFHLYYIFLSRINNHLNLLVEAWNNHAVRTTNLGERSDICNTRNTSRQGHIWWLIIWWRPNRTYTKITFCFLKLPLRYWYIIGWTTHSSIRRWCSWQSPNGSTLRYMKLLLMRTFPILVVNIASVSPAILEAVSSQHSNWYICPVNQLKD